MYINADTIITAGAVLGAVLSIGGICLVIYKWVIKPEQNNKKIENLKSVHEKDVAGLRDELCVLSYATLATLDGLKQLGCNGEVTKAYNDLSKHINKQAHDQL